MKHDYPKLKIWQKAMDLSVNIYEVTSQFPNEKKYGLVSQLRRASVSIPSNIAEGSAYESDRQFLKFLYISIGSLSEVETQCILSEKLNLLTKEKCETLLINTEELRKMLIKFMGTLRKIE